MTASYIILLAFFIYFSPRSSNFMGALAVDAKHALPAVDLSLIMKRVEKGNLASHRMAADPLFKDALEKKAGVYKRSTESRSGADLQKTIILTAASMPYKEFLFNFKCHLDRLALQFLSVSLDAELHADLNNRGFNDGVTYLLSISAGNNFKSGQELPQDSGPVFGSRQFNVFACSKLNIVHAALLMGYSVVFSDVDVAWVRDPLPYIFGYSSVDTYDKMPEIRERAKNIKPAEEAVDFYHTVNSPCGGSWAFHGPYEGNMGLYAVKANKRTQLMWAAALVSCHSLHADAKISGQRIANEREYIVDDQTAFWRLLRHDGVKVVSQHHCTGAPVNGSADIGYVSRAKMKNTNRRQAQNQDQEHAFVLQDSDLLNTSTMTTCALDDCLFSSGALRHPFSINFRNLTDGLRNRGRPVSVHANWIRGITSKKVALNAAGLWLLRERTLQNKYSLKEGTSEMAKTAFAYQCSSLPTKSTLFA
jgi:hypothetical protein